MPAAHPDRPDSRTTCVASCRTQKLRVAALGASAARQLGMFLKRVTCPETAHLEEIEFLETPLGMLIARCSRFRHCAVDCPRTCAARLDRRDNPTVGDERRVGSLLIAKSCMR